MARQTKMSYPVLNDKEIMSIRDQQRKWPPVSAWLKRHVKSWEERRMSSGSPFDLVFRKHGLHSIDEHKKNNA
jgi:hypothetical protein